MINKVEVSHKTIIFIVLLLLGLWFLFSIREIIAWFFISFILMSAFKPLVNFLEQRKLPRLLAIILIYIGFILVFAFIASSVIPPLVTETVRLSQNLPQYLSVLLPNAKLDPQNFARDLTSIGQNLLTFSVGIFNNIIAMFTILVINFYLLLERKNLGSYLSLLMGETTGGRIELIFNKVEERLGAWVRGQLALLLTIGIFTYVGLILLQIPFALSLAIIAGILEIIPTIGPILSSVPAIIVAFTVSSISPLFTAILYFFIQQLENHIVVPQIMRRIVGVPPLISILGILIGAKLAGVGGVILAVPVIVTAETVFREIYNLNSPVKKSVKNS